MFILAVVSAAAQEDTGGVLSGRLNAYIADGWNGLSRSLSDCKSLKDPKVTSSPVLYLPSGMAAPPAIGNLEKECNVQIRHLPRPVARLGDVSQNEIPVPGILYLPNRYVVPGGRFNEMYGWDSYFIILGLLDDSRDDLARGMVENFFFEIENYGALLNANRTYFLTRSQPPLLSSMIRAVYEHPGASPLPKEWLERAYTDAVKDHALWTSNVHAAGSTGLARYRDVGEGPVPEMADDSSYYPDVIRWLLAHPDVHTNYLMDGPENPSAADAEALKTTSCDVKALHVCAHAYLDGHRLTAAYFRGDRAMRESGFDTSFRFGPFSGSTDRIAPVCLNSLLFKYELDLAHLANLLGKSVESRRWNAAAQKRKRTVDRLLWNAGKGFYYDFNFETGQQTGYNYLSGFYPLWAGMATPAQAAAVRSHLPVFEYDGGLAMSDNPSGVQWDMPFGWAPEHWFAVSGLDRYGFHEDAARISRKFMTTVRENFARDGTVREKYNVVSGSANVQVAAGYKSNVIGFGWTNGVYLEMTRLLAAAPAADASD
ncbi:MAG TPA: trehalase family glycosidase [Acidobacteriaceae bacterium]